MTTENLKQAVPFFMVTSMEKSLDFYVRGLGFGIKIEWKPNGTIEWCWLERDGVAVMLQEFREGFLPNDPLGTGSSVCFICRDALDIYGEFLQRNLELEEPFVGNGMWVVAIRDPDGYELVFESLTDVPEETRYSDWLNSKKSD
ncbi:VOC family protein [Algoriphagus sp. A40]|uniref:VOC family protein n=1 Tax=Algoriphagus sp. A40 TaxID=1945863 RepID=UPI00098423F4|nr:VOC family protein [Algoriphagus sp. A40]OOG73025.1 bleomycin resistance protein [Algoriphagus sp. A40]